MSIYIEQGRLEDIDEIGKLYDELNDSLEMGTNYPGWKKGVYPTRDDAKLGINTNSLFVARKDNKIVGSIVLNNSPEKGYEDVKWEYNDDYSSILIVHTLVVHPTFLKLGIGLQLMDFTEEFGRINKMKAVRLDVYEKNVPAIQLYKKCGYKYVDTVDLGLGCYGLDLFELYEKIL